MGLSSSEEAAGLTERSRGLVTGRVVVGRYLAESGI